MSLRRFRRALMTLRSDRFDRNGIISRGRWTAREYVNLNRTLTKVSPSIFSENLYALHRALPSLSFSTSRLLSSSTVFLSFPLVYAHARAANHGTGRRVRESVFLAYYPFLRFSTEGKRIRRRKVLCICVRVSRVRVCVVCVGEYRRYL